ncbi:MAG: ferredoxin [Pseudomonadota bacterium]
MHQPRRFADLAAAVQAEGLTPRGALMLDDRDRNDADLPGEARWLLLLGGVGGSLWPSFSLSPELADEARDPLDRWSLRIISGLAEDLGGWALFPFGGPPYRPFLRWARAAERLESSPIGMLIHPHHGLWHAYRGALAFTAAPADWQPATPTPRPCETCADSPCLSACPVEAFSAAGYDVARCRAHLATPEGRDCMEGGCLARRACPVAPGLAYAGPQAAFHMRAFRGG